ncbi:SPOR domain-containing protein [Methylomonas sp. HW2-6]|uniref:SPOR domain-containing protein n=1 Tax=Methylomonas sp. HW2-6 TaxID=3376687 RepID=UPI004041938D
MDQELKQRLIGAAVITALAAIFVPMLFDDPIDETGKNISELKIPELPAKTQDVEIMPLPEKTEDVAEAQAPASTGKPVPKFVEEGEAEAEFEAPKPQLKLGARDTAPITPAAPPPRALAPVEEEPAEAEDLPIAPKTTKPVAPVQPLPGVAPVPKPLKPLAKPAEAKPELQTQAPVAPPAIKPAAPAEETNRWYLQVGTFSQRANAASLQESLKQQGFAATVKEAAGDKGTVFKVRIGPIVDKAKAQAVKAKLAQINVNSFVSADE